MKSKSRPKPSLAESNRRLMTPTKGHHAKRGYGPPKRRWISLEQFRSANNTA